MAMVAEHREPAAAVGARIRRRRRFCRRFTWRRGNPHRDTAVPQPARAHRAERRVDRWTKGGAAGRCVPEKHVACADFKGLGVLPASERCERAQTLRQRASRAGARGSAGDVAVCLPVSDWQRLTKINSTFFNKSVPSDE
jgi:hypothetical protein